MPSAITERTTSYLYITCPFKLCSKKYSVDQYGCRIREKRDEGRARGLEEVEEVLQMPIVLEGGREKGVERRLDMQEVQDKIRVRRV